MQKKLALMLKELEEEEKAQVVRLGDASIASPFTSKLSTTLCGECTTNFMNEYVNKLGNIDNFYSREQWTYGPTLLPSFSYLHTL